MRKFTPTEYLRVLGNCALYGPSFLRRPYASRASIERYQCTRLKQLLAHAYANTSLYRTKYDAAGVHPRDLRSLADLQRFPLVTKDELIAYVETDFLRESKSHYIQSVSSGSSGKVLTVLHEPADTWAYALGRYRILDMNGRYRPWDLTLYIYTSEYPANSVLGAYRSAFISTLTPIKETLQRIYALRPSFLCTYPSHLLELMQHLSREEARGLHLKVISLGSEMSSRTQRETIADFFQTTVLDEFSSEELGWMATECSYGRYHVWEDICHIEVSHDGAIIGTNLHNFVTPCIRYLQNDLAEVGEQIPCPCGRTFKTIKNIVGRKNDHFTFSNGRVLTPAYLLDSVYAVLLDTPDLVADFCLIQETVSRVTLEILPGKSFADSSQAHIRQLLQSLFPQAVELRVVVTNLLTKTKSGKRNPIISRVTHQI